LLRGSRFRSSGAKRAPRERTCASEASLFDNRIRDVTAAPLRTASPNAPHHFCGSSPIGLITGWITVQTTQRKK
jgi:hypothetical protein